MKKFIHVIDESLEEIDGSHVSGYDVNYGVSYFPDIFLEYRFRGRRRSPDICLYGLHF